MNERTAAGVYYGWVMVAVAFCTLAVGSGGITYSYSVITVIFRREFNVSQFRLMLPLSLMTLASAFIAPLIGPRLDRFPVRRFMWAGALFLVSALWLISLAPSVTFVTVVYALLMSPVPALLGTLSSSVLISRWFAGRLALAMGIASVGVSVGGFVIPPLLDAMCSHLGWRHAFRVLGLAVLVLFVPLIWLVRDRPADGRLPDKPRSKPLTNYRPAVFNTTAAILRHRNFWLIGLVIGFLFSAYTALLTNLLPLVMLKGVNSQQGARLIATISGVAAFGKLAFGSISDRIDLRIGLAVTVLLVIAGMTIYLDSGSFTECLIGSVVLGLAAGNMLPLWSALIARAFGAANYGRVMGLMSPINVACNLVAVPLTGFLYDRTGSYTVPISIFAGLLTLSLLWIPAIRQPPAG